MGINRPFGDYMLLKRVASGGMAEIFLALKRGPGKFEKLVAIKAITGGRGDNELYLKMFQTEAEVAARFNHPHVVQLYDVVEIESTRCMIMEFMPGHTMAEVVEAAQAQEIELSADLAVFLLMEVCEGLHYVHSLTEWSGEPLGIVHRDVSPQNIMLTYDGVAKVFDFGIAQIGGGAGDPEVEGAMAGKVAYMSPEQCRGELLDHRSDIFALGVMLWEMTVGKPLFSDQDRFQIIRALTEEPIPRPSDTVDGYPRFLERIVMKALEKDRTKRYESCQELRDDLAKYLKVSALKPNRRKATELMRTLFTPDEQALAELVRQAPRDAESIAAAAAAAAQRPTATATALPAMTAAQASQMAADLLPDLDDEDPIDRTLEADGQELVAQAIAAQAQEDAERRASFMDLAGINPDAPAEEPGLAKSAAPVSPDILGSDQIPASNPAMLPMTAPPGRSGPNNMLLVALVGVIAILLVAVVALVVMMQGSEPALAPKTSPLRAPVATTGKLLITSEPSGASVELNGRRLSVKTPTAIPGIAFNEPVIVVLVKDGFESSSETFTFSPEKPTQNFDATLKAVEAAPEPKAVGSLRVVASPSNALIFLDDVKVADSSPITLNDITVGPEHTLRISHEGYDDASLPFIIGRGELREIEIELAKEAREGVAVANKDKFRFRVKREGDTEEAAFETFDDMPGGSTERVLRIADEGDTAVAAKMDDGAKADGEADPAAADTEGGDDKGAAEEATANGAAAKEAVGGDSGVAAKETAAKANAGSKAPPAANNKKKEPIEVKPVNKRRENPALKEEPYPMMMGN